MLAPSLPRLAFILNRVRTLHSLLRLPLFFYPNISVISQLGLYNSRCKWESDHLLTLKSPVLRRGLQISHHE